MTQASIHAHEPRIIVSTRQMEQENEKNGVSVQILTECRERISKKQVLRPLAEKRGLEPWKKIVSFAKDK